MYNFLKFILITEFILINLGYNPLFASGGQKKILEKNNIIIYELNPGQGKNNFKALYFVEAHEDDFVNMLLTPENHVQWVQSIKSAKNIVYLNDSTLYTRIVISVKPILNKEGIVKTTITHHPKSRTTYIVQKIDDSIDYDPKYKRLNYFEAAWKIRAISKDKLEVELSFMGMKGNYPDFINDFLKSIFIKKLYQLAYKSKSQANMKNDTI